MYNRYYIYIYSIGAQGTRINPLAIVSNKQRVLCTNLHKTSNNNNASLQCTTHNRTLPKTWHVPKTNTHYIHTIYIYRYESYNQRIVSGKHVIVKHFKPVNFIIHIGSMDNEWINHESYSCEHNEIIWSISFQWDYTYHITAVLCEVCSYHITQ